MPAACRSRPLVPVGALVAATAASVLAGCSSSGGGSPGSGTTLRVDASDTACRVSVNTLAAGPVSIAVSNTGSKVTEVYVYAPGNRIFTERENIGPGTRATVTTELEPGSYEIACKPGMTGDGIRQKITVTGGDASATVAAGRRPGAAVATYRGHVQHQADATLPVVQQFAAAVKTGDLARAQALFAPSQVGRDRTEPVAESHRLSSDDALDECIRHVGSAPFACRPGLRGPGDSWGRSLLE
ncbi:hypothetical protein GCM10010495_46310 [Kitasatospora herbaricolor]|uniref:cupredoxin domain-containing protein n=1 Tax=Kitasatospora herbaricolor TaxID=68217 RepID=UPI001749874B|nr:cupredoxin domain-containing protein [Kitasatospora herbaricolor]MDQ0312939.1 iron uptake system EfeUOB component EfeO/EfeM [Kitasatospora herbaricolor]GGV25202.1 hypothetical protein GCM10010495_46310 [Kitasatospora herbaricolor]